MDCFTTGFDLGYRRSYLRSKKTNLILPQRRREALEMIRSELENKIVETSVLVCVTSDPEEKACYLAALMHYEKKLSSSYGFCNANYRHLDNDTELWA